MANNASCTIDAKDIESLEKLIAEFGDKSVKVINDVLHQEAPNIIKPNIQRLIHSSGRDWKNKRVSSFDTQPFREDVSEIMSVTIRSKTAYSYLYFPDDGSNTKNHQGNQHFMERGASNSLGRITELCTSKLIEKFS